MRYDSGRSRIRAFVPAAAGTLAVFVLVSMCGLPGCSDGNATGTLKVLITDSPYPFEYISEAWVTVTRVEVHHVGDVDEDAEADGLDAPETIEGEDEEESDADGDSPWIVIFEGEREFNLMNLRNGRTDLLAGAELPAGHYNQMRLIVTQGYVVLTDGREFMLTVPSGEQTGIKLHYPFDVGYERSETTLLLDVDMSRAFKPSPNGGINEASDIEGFRFTPSLAMRLIDLLEAGSISGTVTDGDGLALESATVIVFADGDEISTTTTETDGTYMLIGLPTGSYAVGFSAGGYSGAEENEVEVSAGETTSGIDAVLETSGG